MLETSNIFEIAFRFLSIIRLTSKVALKEVIELKAEEIAEKAWRLATHAGRKTVKEEDIKLAVKQ